MRVFLAYDQTNEQGYTKYHKCTHFNQDLRANASRAGIILQGLRVSTHPQMQGDGHAVCVLVIDDTIMVINPQTDGVFTLEEYYYTYDYQYLKFFIDLRRVPARFRGTVIPDVDMENYSIEPILSRLSSTTK